MVGDDLEYWVERVGSFCPWASYIAAEGAPGPLRSPATVRVVLEPWVTGLDRPLGVVWPPGDPQRALVIEKAGVICAGMYLFADYCSGRVWALVPGGRSGWAVAEVGSTTERLVAFGEDPRGELYAVAITPGAIYRVTAGRAAQPPRQVPRRVAP